MKKISTFVRHTTCRALAVLVVCLGVTSCATTQEERLAKIDSFFAPLEGKITKFVGNNPRHRSKRTMGWKFSQESKTRSPIIHSYIYNMSSRNKFVFFYHGRNQNSIRFGEILKKYADETGLSVEAYTLDNRSLSPFPQSVLANQKILEEYFGDGEGMPKDSILFLAVSQSYAMPIAIGEIPYLELIQRMNKVAEAQIRDRRDDRLNVFMRSRGRTR